MRDEDHGFSDLDRVLLSHPFSSESNDLDITFNIFYFSSSECDELVDTYAHGVINSHSCRSDISRCSYSVQRS